MNELVGAWRLLSARFLFLDGEKVDLYGPAPEGRIVFTADGWMSALLTEASAAQTESAPVHLMAYSGRYRIEPGPKFVVQVDVSWSPAWQHTEQTRHFERTGDKLSIVTAEQTHPQFPGRLGRGALVWTLET